MGDRDIGGILTPRDRVSAERRRGTLARPRSGPIGTGRAAGSAPEESGRRVSGTVALGDEPTDGETAVTDRSAFTDDQWHALTDAPVAVMAAMAIIGDHGPISMMKESAAGAKAITRPTESGPADALIAAIVPEAQSKQARHDAKQHKGSTPNVVVDGLLDDVQAASKALEGIPVDEALQVRKWLLSVGSAVAAASKGVKPAEEQLLTRLAGVLGIEG